MRILPLEVSLKVCLHKQLRSTVLTSKTSRTDIKFYVKIRACW